MVAISKILGPDELEHYVARALSDEILGRVQAAWYITRVEDSLPALILFRHTHINLDHVHELCALLLRSGISRGYLVTPAMVPPSVERAAEIIGLRLIHGNELESLLERILEG
jgi:hypothetical protein